MNLVTLPLNVIINLSHSTHHPQMWEIEEEICESIQKKAQKSKNISHVRTFLSLDDILTSPLVQTAAEPVVVPAELNAVDSVGDVAVAVVDSAACILSDATGGLGADARDIVGSGLLWRT